jgi:hypothetical protein
LEEQNRSSLDEREEINIEDTLDTRKMEGADRMAVKQHARTEYDTMR